MADGIYQFTRPADNQMGVALDKTVEYLKGDGSRFQEIVLPKVGAGEAELVGVTRTNPPTQEQLNETAARDLQNKITKIIVDAREEQGAAKEIYSLKLPPFTKAELAEKIADGRRVAVAKYEFSCSPHSR